MKREEFLNKLSEAGHRRTNQRAALVDVMLALDHARPFSAADVFRATKSGVDLVTIYRNLEIFAAAGVICRADFDGEVQRFTLASRGHGHHHHHVTCRRCHRVAAVETCALKRTTEAVKQLGFSDIEHRLEFTATCGACANA